MLRGKGLLTVIMGCVFFTVFLSVASAADNMFVCDLSCSKIGPKPADTDANGKAYFYLDENKQELTYKLVVEKVTDAYMAHLHIGQDGKEGPMAAWLYPRPESNTEERLLAGEYNGVLAEGMIRPEDLEQDVTFEELTESLRAGNVYVNVHTKKYFMGAIRGQVYSQEFASHMEMLPTAAGDSQ